MTNTDLVSVDNLSVSYDGVKVVKDVSFTLKRNETFAIIGESGSGKSTVAKALLGLLEQADLEGAIHYGGENLLTYGPKEWQRLRGVEIAMIYQNPGNYLNPFKRVGDQMKVVLASHGKAYDEADIVALLEAVSLPGGHTVLDSYPFQLSGGMQQRVAIVMSLLIHPQLLIADEPTSALDVLVQQDIVKVLQEVQQRLQNTLLFITHNIQIARRLADRVGIMHEGALVEIGKTEEVLSNPQHEYTKLLLQSLQEVKV
ncbi:ABC transporter ATP-binding protein [Veillonella sp. CHU594]|uniref:ABC transporter ATP-binding protein n=1 Tax=Veillonella sp. CHU594 TaxID=2490948 RepID=UPI000F8CF681|nr:ABC transporter ATP-binding protein [Veillonella sp. CHU594]